MYNTKQRESVLRYFQENTDKHITAGEIIKYFKSQETNISKTTVYRCIEMLLEENLIKKYVIGENESACYQYVGKNNCEEHYHLKCNKCSKLFHVSCDTFKMMEKHLLQEHQFKLDDSKTVLYGTCKDCANN